MIVELNEKEFEMITVFRRLFMNENEVIVVDYINQNNYKEYIGKTVKVTGGVDLIRLGLTKIPINFTEVDGSFLCWQNQLTSLEGAPRKVGGSFDCSFNELKTLVGGPKEVGKIFDCSHNQLTSLKGAPRKVGRHFYCYENKLTSLEGQPEFIGGEFIS